MKTLFGCLVLLVLLAALPAKAGVSYLQSSSVRCGTATSCSAAFKNAVVGGDLIVVAGTWDSSRAVISVSDMQGNTYHPAGSAIAIVDGSQNAQIWYAANARAGATSVTVVLSGVPLFNDIYIHEYSGVDPTNPLDAVSAYTGNGTSLATPDALVSTDALIFGFGPVENGIPSPGSGFSARQTTDDNLTEDKIAGDAGLYSATMLNSLPVNWVCIMAAFNAAGAPAAASQGVSLNGKFTWDTGSAVTGTVSLYQEIPTGDVKLGQWQLGNNGSVNFSVTLHDWGVYRFELRDPSGALIRESALVALPGLTSGQLQLVLNQSNNSVKSAKFTVAMADLVTQQ